MATITEDYVSFETAKLLKEKGFNGHCWSWYRNGNHTYTGTSRFCNSELQKYEYSKPTQQMAMRWLREKHFLHIDITIMNGGSWAYSIEDISVPYDGGIPERHWDRGFLSYEQACEAAIKYCLENLI